MQETKGQRSVHEKMGPLGSSQRSTLTILLCLLVHTVCSVNAELAFLGQEPNRAIVSQGLQTGEAVYQLFVVDTLSNEETLGITFSSSLTSSYPFFLVPGSGQILVTGALSEEEYVFVVQATSSGGITIETNITIVVVPLSDPDTTPRFEHSLYEIEIPENLPVMSAFNAIRAFSLILTDTIQRYSIVAGNTDTDFVINNNNGLLRVNRNLDRERTNFYQLTVRYVDDYSSVDTIVQVSIGDINDETPRFSRSLYNVTITETLPIGSIALTVNATDDDIGANAMVTYSFDFTASSAFSLDPIEGVLRTTEALDYERQPKYQFSITVQDGGSPQLTSVTTVLVNLINIDDECPRFENPIFIEELAYDVTDTPPGVGTEILTVMATDPDRFSSVTYSIVSGHTDVLALDVETGVITLASTDNDPRGQYTLNVSASDNSCTDQSFVQVDIGIGNVNVHSPQFQTDCTANLMENPPLGTEVITLLATDGDIGFNGLVTYSLLSGTNLFEIDTSGVVRTIASPETYDRELQSTLQAGVTASDGGGRQDYCLLTVTLDDENDNTPRIPLSMYSTSLARDSGIGTFVLQISADDPDVGDNGRIEYSIDSSSSSLPFQINSMNGIITTSVTLPSTSRHEFTVFAADMGTAAQLTSSTMVTITLTDGDDLPRFTALNYTGTTCENPTIGTTVLTVNASSTLLNGFIQFTILAGSDYRSNSRETFDIRPVSGASGTASIIIGSRTFVDFEQLSPHLSFQFFVRATNGDESSIVPVEIFVIDIDDNSPEFLTHSLSVTIVENEAIGTTVAQVQAMDPDSGTNGEVLYRFMSGEISPYFDIATNGLITSKIVFDFESAMDTRGNLLIEAYNPNPVDSGSMCGSFTRFSVTTFIEWNILDQNDNPPSFEESLLTVQIQEDAQIQSKILRLNATDMDISDFGVLSFSINSGNDGTFGIESDYIVLTRRLDFETTAEYELVIHVTDGIHSIQDCPQSQCVAIVRILVTDIDDEPPVFSSLEYRASVVENAPTGTSILEILATDIDSPSIEYKLTGLAEGRFTVSQTGVVSVAGPIDREQFPGGSLVFLAFADGGSLATADIVIDIQDVNDYEPRFSGVFSGLVEENSDPGEEGLVVSQVRAVDLDQGENGTVHYSIIFGGENGFRIDKETGVITAHAQYDREATPSFVLVVQATDNGTSIQLSSQTQVVIEIGDVNDNRPRFPFSYMFARVFENSPIGHSVFFLPTIDADSALNSRAIFSLLATNPMETKFSLNLITGEVTIAGSLDYEIPLHRLYTLTVSVVDPDSPSESDVGTLQIVLLDRNDNPPQISVTKSETGLLQETFPIGIQVAMVTASDLDIGQNSELMFEISDGNTNGDFELLVEDGGAIIKSANQFDYETTLSYMLTVTVSDMGSPPLSVSETIDFNIIDVNDEPPIFTQSEYSISILENSAPSVNLIQVQASDRDTGNGGEIDRYELISGNEGGWFALNSSGVLSSLTVFDREERAEYVLTVAAYDRGVVPIQGTARIVVTITDVNDNPSFDGGHLTVLINALNGMVTPGNIAPFHFNDPDSDDSFSGCTVIRQDQTGVFTVDSSCVIHLLVNNPVEGDYNYIEVRGRDGTHTDVTVSATIRVQHFNFARLIAENLITLTLNASVEAYIVDRLNISFPMELARALQVAESNIQIITVQQGTIQPESTVDVTFVARDSNGAYITPAAILHQLFVQRDNLVLNGHGILSLPLDACAAEPCQNQAGCRTIQNVVRTDRVINTQEFVYFAPRIDFSYECVCAPGTTGQNCETNVNDCYSNPCQQGGVCTDTVGGFSCVCPSGYTGDDCSIAPDTCSTNACQNGGTCSIITDDISCNCNPGYYGPLCQYNYFIPSSFCSQDNPCSNGGECSAGRDGYSCVCSPGFSGEVCEIETQIQGGCVGNPCYNGSTCEETLLGPNCICSVGFTGPNCRWPLNSCELEPCLNGGTCTTGLYDTHVCSCAPGYSGDDCSLIIAPCFNEPCLNSGRCMDMDDGSYMCECMSGYYGDDCEISVQPLDFCAMVDCLDNGNCTSGRDTFTCSCDDRYIGVDCAISTLSDDVSCAGNPCQHGSVCMNDASSADGLRCFCSPGFTGSRCETNINDCLNSPCMNEGTCTDGINGYTCTCPSGLAGYDCEVRCPEGLSGTICQVPILQCLDNPCQNNGTCIQTGTKFNCNCPVTHTGSRCESELLCTESTCLNGGRCIATQTGGIMCECGVGFSGENCELLTVSFSGSQTQSSYRAFASLEIRGHGRIEFEFATVDRNGLLLYNTQLQNGRTEDFVAVEIVGGALQVSVSHGSGDSSVRFVSSPRGVADGDWHQVVIETNQKVFRVLLDDCLLLPNSLQPFAPCTATSTTPGTSGFLDLGLPLWLGGIPFSPPVNSIQVSSQGVTGCIRGVRIDGKLLDLEGYVFESNSARGCSHMESDVCAAGSPSVCGGGQCLSVFDGYSCDCLPREEGDVCERAAVSVVYGGGSFAEYSLLEYQPPPVTKRQVSAGSLRSTVSDEISLWFRTERGSGLALLLFMGSEDTGEELYLQLEDGVLILHINLGSVDEQFLLMDEPLADSAWHFVEVKRSALDLITSVDNITSQHTLKGTQLSLDVAPIIYAGGRPDSGGTNIVTPYLGCMEDIRIDRNPLPTVSSNNFASVVFTGNGISYNCALGLCLPNPCGRGNCSEITLTTGRNSFECECESGHRLTGSSCPGEPTPSMFTLIIVFVTVAGGLLLCVTIVLMGMLSYRYRRKLQKDRVEDNANDISLSIFNRQCMGVSNEAGGGERDTHIGIDEISSTLFTNKRAIENDEKQQSESQSSSSSEESSIAKIPYLSERAASPTIGAFIKEKIEGVPKEYRDIDSLYEFEDEGEDSIAGSLSTICSSLAGSEYTVEQLREAGPEFEPFIDLLASVLESDEEEDSDGGSQQAHTGNTQPTQATLYSQDLW